MNFILSHLLIGLILGIIVFIFDKNLKTVSDLVETILIGAFFWLIIIVLGLYVVICEKMQYFDFDKIWNMKIKKG